MKTTTNAKTILPRTLSHYYEAVRIPLCLFREKELVSRLPAVTDFNLPLLLMSCLDETLPPIWYCDTPEHLFFGGIRLEATGKTLFLGPATPFTCSIRQADSILSHIGRGTKDRQTLLDHFSNIPLCDAPTLQANLRFLDFLLNGMERNVPRLPFQWKELLPPQHLSLFYPEIPNEDWIERNILSYVKYGQTDSLSQFLNTHVLTTTFHTEIPDRAKRLQTLRTYIFGANMLISHAAMDGGLDYGFGMQMSSEYIELIQNARTETDLSNLFAQLCQDYTRQVARLKRLDSNSLLVRQINRYIQSHLYEKISPASAALVLNKNCTYLCTCFKKETGKTIANYIQECKIDEAKRLLEFGSLGITEISELLCFTNASYFCKIFKKWNGVSPARFRKG